MKSIKTPKAPTPKKLPIGKIPKIKSAKKAPTPKQPKKM